MKEKKNGESMTINLKKESGAWKVAFDKSSMMQQGMDKMKEKGMDMDKSNDIPVDTTAH